MVTWAGTPLGSVNGYRVEGLSQPAVGRGSPVSSYQQKLLYHDGDRAGGAGQERWSNYSSSTLALRLFPSDEILYIIIPSFNPSPLHPRPALCPSLLATGSITQEPPPLSPPLRFFLFFVGIWPGIATTLPFTVPTSLGSAEVPVPLPLPQPSLPQIGAGETEGCIPLVPSQPALPPPGT